MDIMKKLNQSMFGEDLWNAVQASVRRYETRYFIGVLTAGVVTLASAAFIFNAGMRAENDRMCNLVRTLSSDIKPTVAATLDCPKR